MWQARVVAVIVALEVFAAGAAVAQRGPYALADVEDGQRLFMGSCANCHGPDGDAVPGVDLGHGQFRRASTDSELAEIIRRGIAGTAMPPGNYSNTQATQIVSYLRSLAALPRATTAPGNPERGRVLFEGKGQCLTCHRLNGKGSRLGPDITDIGSIRRAADLERALVEPAATVRPQNRNVRVVTREGTTITGRLLNHDTFTLQMLDAGEQLRSFAKSSLREITFIPSSSKTSYRGKLTAEEIADLVAYLVTLRGVKPVTP
jgi:putative heme-binding domain-containing protein